MAIDPVGPNRTPSAGAQQARQALRNQGATPAAAGGTDAANELGAADSLTLSADAVAGADNQVPSGTLDAAALRTIAERIASGAYDSAEVADRIAGKLLSTGEI